MLLKGAYCVGEHFVDPQGIVIPGPGKHTVQPDSFSTDDAFRTANFTFRKFQTI